MFDESLNKSTQQKQMDVHVRYWHAGQVTSRYLGSEFMGHATAADKLKKLTSSLSGLYLPNIIQISMDGPNVNWKLFETLQSDLKTQSNVSLLNVGSCGLHQVHEAFKNGSKASGWDVDKLLSSFYWIFKDTPARREDFVNETNSTEFPLKFCNHRWVENVPVCERAIAVLPAIQKYVSALAAKRCTDPKTKSFITISENVRDPLLPVKLANIWSIAKLIQPFLTIYQSDAPMIPFLYGDLKSLINSLMERFVKTDVLKHANSIHKINIADDKNLLDYKKVDVGFSAQKILKDLLSAKKISDRQFMEFRMECRAFLQGVVKQLLLKSPLNYNLAKNISVLDPRRMSNTDTRDINKNQFRDMLRTLVDAGRFAEKDADTAMTQYSEFIDNIVFKHISKFATFDPSKSRVDVLLFDYMASDTSYNKLWIIVKQLLLLSHGQATVERGFSVNRHIEVENITDETVSSRRMICDHMKFVGGITNIDITNKRLLISCSSARQKYVAHLEDEKKESAATAEGKNEKLLKVKLVS